MTVIPIACAANEPAFDIPVPTRAELHALGRILTAAFAICGSSVAETASAISSLAPEDQRTQLAILNEASQVLATWSDGARLARDRIRVAIISASMPSA